MGDFRQDPHAERFGHYLRRVRESKKLSLDAVEEMAMGYPDRLTKSHLSRIENGLAEPTFRRLYSLSQIYGVPVTTLAERFELDLLRERVPEPEVPEDLATLRERVWRLVDEGRFLDALIVLDARLLFEDHEGEHAAERIAFSIQRVHCLNRIGHYETAKQESERILEIATLTTRDRVVTLHFLAVACLRQSKCAVAMLAVDHAERLVQEIDDRARLEAHLLQTKGQVLTGLGEFASAAGCFERAAEGFKAAGKMFEWTRATRNLAAAYLEQGKTKAARRFLDEVIRYSEKHGYERHLAFALSDKAVIAWKESDLDGCESFALRSNRIARASDFASVVFRNCFYLWRVAGAREDARACRLNEQSLKAYLGRADSSLPERTEFVAWMAGGQK